LQDRGLFWGGLGALGLLVFLFGWAPSGLGALAVELIGAEPLGAFLRQDVWPLTFCLLAVPLGVSAGVCLGAVRRALKGRAAVESRTVRSAFVLGGAVAVIASLAALRVVRPEGVLGFGCYGPGPTSLLAGRLLMDAGGMSPALAAAFVFPVKVALLL